MVRLMDARLLDSIKRHEGLRLQSYQDTEGVWTVGYGHNLEANGVFPKYAQYVVVDADGAERLLRDDIVSAQNDARRFSEYGDLNTVARRNVFVEMTFNLGAPRLSRFTKTLAAIKRNDYTDAAAEMLDSRWARQVGRRANTLAAIMRTGDYP